MYVHTYRKTVHSQMETLRKLLVDSIDHPEKYRRGIQKASVEHVADGVVRETRKDGTTIREEISFSERKNEFLMTSRLMEHPLYDGKILTRIVPASVQNPMSPLALEVTLELERKSFKVEGMLPGETELVHEIEKEMDLLKSKAEEIDRNG